MISRAERTPFSDWAWTIDRWLLAAIALLIISGLVFAMAGSPPVAERLHLATFHFVNRQVAYLFPALAVMLAASLLSPRHVRRAALVIFLLSLALVIATLFFGQEVKGARRWLFGVQPSEFLKPAFVVMVAWAFSEGARRKDVPGTLIAVLLFPLTIIPLVLQPDFGQTMLITIVWGALFFMAGLHLVWVVGLGGLAGVAALLAYRFVPHVAGADETVGVVGRAQVGEVGLDYVRTLRVVVRGRAPGLRDPVDTMHALGVTSHPVQGSWAGVVVVLGRHVRCA